MEEVAAPHGALQVISLGSTFRGCGVTPAYCRAFLLFSSVGKKAVRKLIPAPHPGWHPRCHRFVGWDEHHAMILALKLVNLERA